MLLLTGPEWERELRRQQAPAAEVAALVVMDEVFHDCQEPVQPTTPEPARRADEPQEPVSYSDVVRGSSKASSTRSYELRGFLTSTVPHLLPTLDSLAEKVEQGNITSADALADLMDQALSLQEVTAGLADGSSDLDPEAKEAAEFMNRQMAVIMHKLCGTPR